MPARYRVEHKIKFVSSSGHVIFFLLYKHTDDEVFDDFPKISEHFPKICEDSSKVVQGQTNIPKHCPKISEDYRRLPKISEEESVMF